MDTGIVSKPSAGAVASDFAQAPIGAGIKAAPTVLPADKTVTAMRQPEAPRNDLPRHDQTKNQVIIDPQTRDVIFRVIDVASRRVVRQLPDEALVRLRAYTRALTNRESPSSSSASHTDREI